ncbi:glycosyltransferase family 39 protein [Candidatus Roizmanbacteria bacterium]|nr:MAG: glycosyltransferase family 39 protein [Candidatus Roizmanbacteria bacterium]
MRRIISFFNRRESRLVLLVVLIGAIAHAVNMFHFPYYENDEAIYLGRAWSLINLGQMDAYTYWYDHAPLGWMMLAGWYAIIPDFFSFGFSVNFGRVFMLLMHMASSILVYFIMKKLSGSRLASALSVIIFSFSPLAIYFQRRILLDNIMVFWVLVSLAFLLYYNNKLRNIMFSAIAFGFSFLSKETSVFMLPVFVYIVYLQVHKHHRLFAVIKWISYVGLVVSLYFLYALLKGELFPEGMFGSANHVSLIETLIFQAERDGGSIFDISGSTFWHNFGIWMREDPVIILLGFGTTLVNLIIGIRQKAARILSLLTLSLIGYLVRGGIVIEFYIIPLFPFFAMNIAYAGYYLGEELYRNVKAKESIKWIPNAAFMIVLPIVFVILSFSMRDGHKLYLSDQTEPQMEAIEYMLSKQYRDAFYTMDNYGFVDLMEKNNGNFAEAHHYWKVEYDPEIQQDILKGNPGNIDYFLISPQLLNDVNTGVFPFVGEALANSRPIATFSRDGWGVEIWGTEYPQRILQATWASYKDEFIHGGRVIDPATKDTTSEGQSYALLRAVLMDDKKTFDQVYSWTKGQLQTDENLFLWSFKRKGDDKGTASDADADIALALAFAYKQWDDPAYLSESEKVLNGIWDHEVVVIGDDPYMTAGNWASGSQFATINPSYLSPSHYEIFAQIDKSHDWGSLVDTSYDLLQRCSFGLSGGREVLPPEWCVLDRSSREVRPSEKPGPEGIEYGYNAIRVPMRVALDYQWFGRPEAKEYLSSLAFLGEEWNRNGKLYVSYTHDGQPWDQYESAVAYAGNLGYFLAEDPKTAEKIYSEKILSKLYENKKHSYWEDPENYYTQNIVWFATALYGEQFPNLWSR